MRRIEEPDPAAGPRLDPLFALGALLFVGSGVVAAFAWMCRWTWVEPARATTLAAVAGAVAVAGGILAAARAVSLGPTMAMKQLRAPGDLLGTDAWARRNPWVYRVLGLAASLLGLLVVPYLAAKAEPNQFEYPRVAALCFLLLAGVAVETVCRAGSTTAMLPSPWARAAGASAVVFVVGGASIVYFRETGLAAPWHGPWGDDLPQTAVCIAFVIVVAVVDGIRRRSRPGEPGRSAD